MDGNFLLNKLSRKHVWKRILLERLCEPIHLNVLSLPVALAGSFRSKVAWDLVVRQQHAFGLLTAADTAKECGLSALTAIEFGVANGAGLINICDIAKRVTKATGVGISVLGFDTGTGLPLPQDYRDHPEAYKGGDYVMRDTTALKRTLEEQGAKLILGDIRDTVAGALRSLPPVGFVSIDVDYHSSTVDALRIFKAEPTNYLPWVMMYLDDIDYYRHSRFCCELRAIEDFNEASTKRKIAKAEFIRQQRIFQRPRWIEKMYVAHIFDHPFRNQLLPLAKTWIMENPYLERNATAV